MNKQKTKAKRKLSNIDFTHEGGHLALCTSEQGVANGADYALVIKSTEKFSEEVIEKMQQVRVTMELPDFLEKFFSLYWEDAQLLARMMGYEEPEESEECQSYDSWIESRLESFEILKSLYESENIQETLSKLSGEDYLGMAQDQERIEKFFKKYKETDKSYNKDIKKDSDEDSEKSSKKGSTKNKKKVGAGVAKEVQKDALAETSESSDSPDGGLEPTDSKEIQKQQEEVMTKKAEGSSSENEVELLKAQMQEQVAELQKALESQKEELQKAQEQVQQYKVEKQALKDASRKESLKDVVTDEKQVEVLFKAFGQLENDEDFQATVEVFKSMKAVVDASDAFKEVGVSGEGDPAPANGLKEILKKKYQSK